MKKIFITLLSLCLILSMAGCSLDSNEPSVPADTVPETQTETGETSPAIAQAAMAAVAVPTVTETSTAEDGTELFKYTYQSISLVLPDPEVADKVIIDFLNRIDQTREDAESVAQMAQGDYNGQEDWIPYLYHVTYSPMRIDQGVLSLFGANVTYSGAFHPERVCLSASYDLINGEVLTLGSIMDPNAEASDFCTLVLNGLAEMGSENYLYKGYEDTVKQRFTGDESLDQAWYFSQTGLCFYFAPYEIAPYSSGVITVEIPYEKLDGLLHSNYFPAEQETASGDVTIRSFEDAELSQFTQIAELIQSKEGSMYLVYTDKAVQDLRIIVSDAASSYTVFAAYGLTPGDGVMVQADALFLESMKISYKSNDTITTVPFTAE